MEEVRVFDEVGEVGAVVSDGDVEAAVEDGEEVEEVEVVEEVGKSLNEVIETAVESAVGKALENKSIVLRSAVAGETGREVPDNRVDFSKMSYSELCAFLESHKSNKLF